MNESCRVVYSPEVIKVGDRVAYPGIERGGRGRMPYAPSPPERDPRDWLEVTRIEGEYVYGTRVTPQEWEIEQEYAIYPFQLRENGAWLEPALRGCP